MAYDRRRLIAELDRLLSANPHLRLARVAHDLGVERHTIEHVVHERKATSFRKYQEEKLLRKALGLLTDESRKSIESIKQIAISLGYASSDPFSRFIKAHTGRTPTQIRKDPRKFALIRRD